MRGCLIYFVFFIYLLTYASCTYSELEPSPENQQTPPPQESLEFQHSPYAEQMCDACHGSNKPSDEDVINETPDLCYDCHEAYSEAFVHSPVSVGECLICHDAHKSDHEFLLKERIPQLCYLCHTRVQEVMADKNNVKHSPAIDKCVACHNPHTSDTNSKFLQQDMRRLCTECHNRANLPMQKYVANVTNKHKPVEEDGSCAQCHAPHASSVEFHLTANPMDVCLKCHNKQVTAYDGEVLANIDELLRDNPSWHGPIREKNCSGCHNPHGSNYFRILEHDYPRQFYTDVFSLDNYELCFSCHESALLRNRETITLTNFRDGKRNLHFLHVNREEKGRTCRACHETHASTHPRHIRNSVPFGKIHWSLQLKYQVDYVDLATGGPCDAPSPTCVKTGGSCVGCHAREHYNYRTDY